MCADIVVGNAGRFGAPIGFGGPHAGYLVTKDELKRAMPGRIIGVSKDVLGNEALRMALQTREQHIRREKVLRITISHFSDISRQLPIYVLPPHSYVILLVSMPSITDQRDFVRLLVLCTPKQNFLLRLSPVLASSLLLALSLTLFISA